MIHKPAAFILLAALGGAAQAQPSAIDWSTAQPVTVTLSNFAIAPDDLHLKAGQPYRLHFVNSGSGGHNFSAPAFFQAAQLDPADQGLLTKGSIELGKGETRDVRLVPTAGSYKVKCTHFMHSAFGMKSMINVE